MSFLPLVIINKTTWFSRLRLYFDLYARFIVFSLCGTNKILRAIVLLFCLNVFQSFIPAGNSIPSQLYWSIEGLIFDIFSGWLSMLWWFNASYRILKTFIIFSFWINYCFFIYYPFGSFYTRFSSFPACFMKMIRQ